MEKSKSIPNYINIFEKRVADQIKRIKDELEKPKNHRNKKLLKMLLRDVKTVKQSIKQAKEDHQTRCPHCNKPI